MKKWKQLLSSLMAAAMLLTGAPSAFAAVSDTGFADVAANAWYADAVEYVRDNGLMSGTSTTTFSPDGTMTRAMLATTLYREAGSPFYDNVIPDDRLWRKGSRSGRCLAGEYCIGKCF